MRVLIACEFSGIMRDAFRKRGHDAWSCDLLDCEADPTYHYKQDALEVAYAHQWDLMIAHPPCTYLANSGVQWLYLNGIKENGIDTLRLEMMKVAAYFYKEFLGMKHIEKRAIENPRMHRYAVEIIGSKADQFVHPWWFGHGETKATGFHLINLPELEPTNIVHKYKPVVHYEPPGPNRWKNRSRTKPGLAEACAEQWGKE